MKKQYIPVAIATALLFLGSVYIAFGAVTYSRTPSGSEITSPVTFNVSFDDFSDIVGELVCGSSCDFWRVGTQGTPPEHIVPSGACVPSSQTSGEFSESFPVGYKVTTVFTVVAATQEDCESADPGGTATGDQGYIFEDNYPNAVFTIIEAVSNALTFPTSTATQFLNNISITLADPGLFTVIVVFMGIYLSFYIIEKLINISSFKKEAQKAEKGLVDLSKGIEETEKGYQKLFRIFRRKE